MFVSRAILPPPPHILDLFPVAQNLMAHLSPMRRSQGVTEMRPGTETRGGGSLWQALLQPQLLLEDAPRPPPSRLGMNSAAACSLAGAI